MLQPVFDFIEKFATDFTWKRLVIFLSFVVLLGIIFFLYESQTATNQLSKYERSIAILKNIEVLKLDNNESKEVANNVYLGLIKITEQNFSPASFKTNFTTEFKQALLAASPWLLFCLVFIPAYFRHNEDAPSIIGGTLILATIMGTGGYFIPKEWSSWIGFGVYPFGINLIILLLLMWYGNRTKT